ncbi:hydrogenase maturation protease [Nodosilinea sp. PGN35]|uniref:hydrogenase maturation protease n=1 Tax=Nodosilinea sp. PGN35 TaxID=3020489 RepID=UPI0023B34B46|nr:hydrogenase maturation protease [Nodosilinea sp. TSF1-S3]MDF0369707.1 hydrogenase maturation protease [Nodosilinea sp. TSF1-S3]
MTPAPPVPHPCTFLIIGYGNSLRGDDGVGPQVAQTVSDWRLPSVKALSVPQLLPELVVEMRAADYVIFVDAWGKCGASTPYLEPVVATPAALAHGTIPALNHVCDPAVLVALTQRLYGHHPQAWLLQIPTERCDLGGAFSKTAKHGVDSALRIIEQFLTTYLRPVFTPLAPCTKSA